MLLDYGSINPTGRPRKKLNVTRQDQAVVYDFLMNDTTATQAAKKLGMQIASFRHFVSYVIQYWVNVGFMGFAKEVKSIEDFIEKEA